MRVRIEQLNELETHGKRKQMAMDFRLYVGRKRRTERPQLILSPAGNPTSFSRRSAWFYLQPCRRSHVVLDAWGFSVSKPRSRSNAHAEATTWSNRAQQKPEES